MNKERVTRPQVKVQRISIAKIQGSCEEVSELLRALSHPQRLMILGHLTTGAKSVSELQLLCGISQSQLSQFLIRMKNEGLVACQRQGRYQYYSTANEKVLQLIAAIQQIFCH